MAQVSVYEARNNLSKLIKEAQSGHEVTITSRGVPVARLVPPRAGSRENFGDWLSRNRPPEAARRTAEQIESSIAAEREGWE